MGRLLEALRAESGTRPAATPATPMPESSRVAKVAAPRISPTKRLLAALRAHGLPDDWLGLDHGDVSALAAWTDKQLADYLAMLADTADRHAGRVPLDDTAAMHCEHCGPVWIHPDIAAVLPVVDGWPRALGCPWCFVRKAGGYIPRPPVTCEGCRHFTPDTINPAAGMGVCGAGKGMHYPMQRHACAVFSTSIEKGDLG